MISYGDMLDTLEKNEPQKELSVAEKKGDNVPEKKGGDNVPEKKEDTPKTEGEPKNDEPQTEDVI